MCWERLIVCEQGLAPKVLAFPLTRTHQDSEAENGSKVSVAETLPDALEAVDVTA